MSIEKENFLRTRLVPMLQQLPADTPSRWGKMNVQQMIEHLAGDAFRTASGRLVFEKIWRIANSNDMWVVVIIK